MFQRLKSVLGIHENPRSLLRESDDESTQSPISSTLEMTVENDSLSSNEPTPSSSIGEESLAAYLFRGRHQRKLISQADNFEPTAFDVTSPGYTARFPNFFDESDRHLALVSAGKVPLHRQALRDFISSTSTDIEVSSRFSAVKKMLKGRSHSSERKFCTAYLGKVPYEGREAYFFGNAIANSQYPPLRKINVRVFNPNSNPPVWGTIIHQFLIGEDEPLENLISMLLQLEDADENEVHLEYAHVPGDCCEVLPSFTCADLRIRNNDILHFFHRLNRD